MKLQPLRRLIVALLFSCTFLLGPAAADVSNLTVAVAGAGASYDEAKADAIKKALQAAFKQLVVVDRIVSGDEVLRDRVLSTSNGYVEKFVEKGRKKTDTAYEIEAEITVSATRIENFLGVMPSSGGAVEGPLLGQEVQRRLAESQALKNQARARGEIFDRVFENYPMKALDIRLKSIALSDKDPRRLVLKIEQSYRPEFIQELEQTFRALSLLECELPYGEKHRISVNDAPVCPYKDTGKLNAIIQKHVPPASSSSELRFANGCIVHPQLATAKCFLLDNGNYLFTRADGWGYQIFGKFIDAGGESALTRNRCILIGQTADPKVVGSTQFWYNKNMGGVSRNVVFGWGFWLSTRKRSFELEIDSAEVDLQRAARFVAVGGYRHGNQVADLISPDKLKDPCDLVDDAARLDLQASAEKP